MEIGQFIIWISSFESAEVSWYFPCANVRKVHKLRSCMHSLIAKINEWKWPAMNIPLIFSMQPTINLANEWISGSIEVQSFLPKWTCRPFFYSLSSFECFSFSGLFSIRLMPYKWFIHFFWLADFLMNKTSGKL